MDARQLSFRYPRRMRFDACCRFVLQDLPSPSGEVAANRPRDLPAVQGAGRQSARTYKRNERDNGGCSAAAAAARVGDDEALRRYAEIGAGAVFASRACTIPVICGLSSCSTRKSGSTNVRPCDCPLLRARDRADGHLRLALQEVSDAVHRPSGMDLLPFRLRSLARPDRTFDGTGARSRSPAAFIEVRTFCLRVAALSSADGASEGAGLRSSAPNLRVGDGRDVSRRSFVDSAFHKSPPRVRYRSVQHRRVADFYRDGSQQASSPIRRRPRDLAPLSVGFSRHDL